MFVRDLDGCDLHESPSGMSRVPFTNVETGRTFALNCGLLSSAYERGTMVPRWQTVTTEILRT